MLISFIYGAYCFQGIYGFVTEISNFKDSRKLRQFLQSFWSFLLLMPQKIMWKGYISFSSRFFLRTKIISKVFLNHKCVLRYFKDFWQQFIDTYLINLISSQFSMHCITQLINIRLMQKSYSFDIWVPPPQGIMWGNKYFMYE